MSATAYLPALINLRQFYNSGGTRTYNFRLEQLKKLKQALLAREDEIYAALYSDLKKSKEEAYATELGLVIAELNLSIKKLGKWMRPHTVKTDLLNLPSSSKIYHDPLGVVLIISPWNYPLQLLLIPLIGAIAGGNCAVVKPSELAPATAVILEKIIKESFNEAYVMLLQGDGAAVIPAMMESFRFDLVFYTGSIPVGKIIYQLAARDLIPCVLELGGKSPAIVEADANLNIAARRIVMGKLINVGQTCIAPDYLLVQQSVKELLLQKIKAAIVQFYGDDPSKSYDYGKIINDKRFDKLIEYKLQGKLLLGGESDKTTGYIAPTIIEVEDLNLPVMNEEIFGPILPVITFNTTMEAMQIIQHNANPLAFYLFTGSKSKEAEWINAIPFGGGCINNTDYHFTNHYLPFGGVGNSGIGAYHGRFTFNTFTRQKPVMKTPGWFDPSFKYPSFKGRLKLFKWFIS